MLMIKAIVAPECSDAVIDSLGAEGFSAITRVKVKDRSSASITVNGTNPDEQDMDMLMICCQNTDKSAIVSIIADKTNLNDISGKIFISPVDEVYTISSKTKGL